MSLLEVLGILGAKRVLEESFQIAWVYNGILEVASEIWSLKVLGKTIEDRNLVIGCKALRKSLNF